MTAYPLPNAEVDLTGHVALVTGARVKIGFRIALKARAKNRHETAA